MTEDTFLRDASGKVVQVQEYRRVGDLLRTSPQMLTDWDLEILRSFDGVQEADRAAAARDRARDYAAPLTAVQRPPVSALRAATDVVLMAIRPPKKKFDRAGFLEQCRQKQPSVAVGVYDTARYLLACEQLDADPQQLTDEDVRQLTTVDAEDGAAAVAARAGFVRPPGDLQGQFSEMPASLEAVLASVGAVRKSLSSWIKTAAHLGREARVRLDEVERRLDTPVPGDTVAQLSKAVAEIARLEDRIVALEERKTMVYRGGFESGASYRPGDTCTWDGHLWYCKSATSTIQPGYTNEQSLAWQLAVKAGREGKRL